MTRRLDDRESRARIAAVLEQDTLAPTHNWTVSLLVVTSGLPGVGKSAIARELARRCSLFHLELDHLEAALFRQGISGDQLGWAGYDMITAVAADNLAIGHKVVLDAVGWTAAVRQGWAVLAAEHRADFRPIEVICSDRRLHRERLVQRRRNIDGFPETSWDDVRVAEERFEPWTGERLILDTAAPMEALVRRAVSYLGPPRP